MSTAPHREPRPPRLSPDDPYQLQPVQPEPVRDITSEIWTISVIVAALVLFGVGVMLWYQDSRPSAQTPPLPAAAAETAAAELALRVSGTPLAESDIDATRTAATASTNHIAATESATNATRTPETDDAATPDKTGTALGVRLPVVSSNDQDGAQSTAEPSETPQPPSATPSPTATDTPATQIVSLPFLSAQQAPPTDTPPPPTATAVPEPTIEDFFTPTSIAQGTPVGTPLATATSVLPATPTFGPTPNPYVDDDMEAVMAVDASFFLGPAAVYTETAQLSSGVEISLHGRDRTGEWVYACCVDDDDDDSDANNRAWVRQAFVTIQGNELSDEDDEDFDRNDARWLPIVSRRPEFRALPTVTPPPEGDFPLYRYTADNRGYVPGLPDLRNASSLWTNPPEAGGELVSPLVVSEGFVYAGSMDGHVYEWDRTNGSQRDRKRLSAPVTIAPAADDGLVYVADDAGWVHALQGPIGGDSFWSLQLANPPVSGINVFSHTLFIGTDAGLFLIDGEEGNIVHQVGLPVAPRHTTIGGQLVYVAADILRAYDVLTMLEKQTTDIIWTQPNIPVSNIPPVYTSQGVESLAELYVAGANNRIYSIDANTGRENWNEDNGEPVRSLAVNASALFISGDGYVKARTRYAPEQDGNPILWRTSVSGPVIGGLLVDDQFVIAILQTGSVMILDAKTGDVIGNLLTYPANPGAGGAVSFPNIYAPGRDGKLYGFRSTNAQ